MVNLNAFIVIKVFIKKDRLSTTHLISCDKDVIDELQSFETNTTVTILKSKASPICLVHKCIQSLQLSHLTVQVKLM